MTEFEGHGWAIVPWAGFETTGLSKTSLHIGTLPGRKSVCLYGHMGKPGQITVYAYFKTPALAQEALDIFDRLMKK